MLQGQQTPKSPNAQVNEAYVAEDVRADYEAGLEYAQADSILRMVQRGDQRQYLVRCAIQGVEFTSCGLLRFLGARPP